jgi:hypothetical protein
MVALSRTRNPWEFVPATCALLSFWHCFWLLLVFMRRLPPKDRSGLLMRQLWYIAVSDMISAIFSIVMFVLDQVPYQTTHMGCAASQYTIWGMFLLSIGMSILVQAHFTAGLLMSLRHWKRGLVCLSRILPVLMLPSMVIAGLDVWATMFVFDFDPTLGCVWFTRDDATHRSAPFTAGLALAVILVNSIVYVLLLLEECSCFSCCMPSVIIPGSVGARVFRQARRYMLVTLCTWLPYWLMVLLPTPGGSATLTWASNSLQAVSAAGVTLNGAMNVWSFALHNRHIKRAILQTANEATAAATDAKALSESETACARSIDSRHVGFNPTLQICELIDCTINTANSISLAVSSRGGSLIQRQSATGLLSANGEDPLGFLFFTDCHYPSRDPSRWSSPTLLQ